MSFEDPIHAVLTKSLHQRDLLTDALGRAATLQDEYLLAKLQHALLQVEAMISLITSMLQMH